MDDDEASAVDDDHGTRRPWSADSGDDVNGSGRAANAAGPNWMFAGADHGPSSNARSGSAFDNDAAAGPHVDWGLPVELPWDVLRRMVATGEADIHAIVIRNGVVLHAPGRLDLGRTTRLANHAQRRALRALYPTCAVPGCCVRFEYTQAHHVIWWKRGGRTDFINLLPLCSKHHHLVHSEGWHLRLDESRNLTITLPDGTDSTNALPKSRSGRPKPAAAASRGRPATN